MSNVISFIANSFVAGIIVWLLVVIGYVEICIQLVRWQERRAYRKREAKASAYIEKAQFVLADGREKEIKIHKLRFESAEKEEPEWMKISREAHAWAEAKGLTLADGSSPAHCDDLVLHLPGECVFCDKHPELQKRRLDLNVAFTGQGAPGFFNMRRDGAPYNLEADLYQCPSEWSRPVETINRWGGNVAKTKGDLRKEALEWLALDYSLVPFGSELEENYKAQIASFEKEHGPLTEFERYEIQKRGIELRQKSEHVKEPNPLD